ncbi:MAG: transcriptional repressor QapR [Rhodospirillales bacterium]
MTIIEEHMTLGERMRIAMPGLSPAERRVVRRILSGPARFETAATFAAEAQVSTPTVLRCLGKLGFPGYAAFRALALREAGERGDSALAQMGRRGPDRADRPLRQRLHQGFTSAIDDTFERLDDGEIERALDLLADGSRRQLFAGGRFSQALADQLYGHAHLIRAGCELASFAAQTRAYRLVDVGRSHVVTLFDFRRYQRDSVEFAREAKRRRAKLILVTDPWMSPIADWAEVVLVADVRSASPFDTLVPALSMTETLIAGLYERLGADASERLAGFEALSEDFEWKAP